MSLRCVIQHPNAGDMLAAGALTVRVAVHPRNANVGLNVQEYGGPTQTIAPSPATGGAWTGSISLNAGKFYFMGATGSLGGGADTHSIFFSTVASVHKKKDGDEKKKRRRRGKYRGKAPAAKPEE